nr:MAG TPA: hypothetical protein [Caudoviricetes sp.]
MRCHVLPCLALTTQHFIYSTIYSTMKFFKILLDFPRRLWYNGDS